MEEDIINAKDADEMPLYLHSECNKQTEYEARKRCADKKMLEFVYENTQYPENARTQRKEGTVVVTFVVEKDGTMTDPRIARDPGYDMSEEALRVIKQMQAKGVVWKPGTKGGELVRVQFYIPIRYKLK